MGNITLTEKGHIGILQNIAEGGELSETLNMLCNYTELREPGIKCSILLYDALNNQLLHGAAPSLPSFFSEAVDGLQAGDGVGSCGTAAFTAKRVIVDDIDTHPYWQPYLALAQRANLKACWSQPILSKTQKVIGTFAMYYNETRYPSDEEIIFIEQQANLACIAIESDLNDKEMREHSLRLNSLIQSQPDVISRFTKDGTITFANQACADFMAREIKDIIGLSLYDLIQTKDHQRLMGKFAKLSPNNPSINVENLVRTPSGEMRMFEWRNHAHFDDEGNIFEIQSSGRDITERNKAEKTIIEARREAELANRAKSEFLANMSHELRTPLNAIIGFSEILTTDDYQIFNNEKRREYAEDINNSGRFLLNLINDILDTAKIEANRLTLTENRFSVSELINSCFNMINIQLNELGLKFEIEVPEDLPMLIADHTRTQQMLTNLLSNALKFTDKGGIITVSAGVNDEGGIFICVSDTGIGIAQKDLAFVLSKFGQVDTAYERNNSGTGLGLSLVQLLINAHDGAFKLESDLGKGSRATLGFPKGRTDTI